MRPATKVSSLRSRGACVVVLLGVLDVVWTTSACLSSNAYSCSVGTSFQVFEASLPTSAVPLCTDATDAEVPPQTIAVDSGPGSFVPQGSSFPGASTLSSEGLAQCAALCAGASSAVPCCQSQWEPSTILCTPACQ